MKILIPLLHLHGDKYSNNGDPSEGALAHGRRARGVDAIRLQGVARFNTHGGKVPGAICCLRLLLFIQAAGDALDVNVQLVRESGRYDLTNNPPVIGSRDISADKIDVERESSGVGASVCTKESGDENIELARKTGRGRLITDVVRERTRVEVIEGIGNLFIGLLASLPTENSPGSETPLDTVKIVRGTSNKVRHSRATAGSSCTKSTPTTVSVLSALTADLEITAIPEISIWSDDDQRRKRLDSRGNSRCDNGTFIRRENPLERRVRLALDFAWSRV
jgi:hypothetical protein